MNVLHLSGSKAQWSGNEQQLADLIFNLNQLGVQNSIFCYEDSAISEFAKEHQIDYSPQQRKSIYSIHLAKALRQCIRDYKIDVLHIHTSNFLTVYMLADLLLGLNVPTIFSRKGFSEKSSFLSRLKYNYKNIDYTICVSKAVKEGLKKFVNEKNHDKLVPIYDGIRLDQLLEKNTTKISLPEDKIILGNIANHVPAKDLMTLIRAIDVLINEKKYKSVHLVQIGKETQHTAELKSAVSELGLNDNISFLGQIPKAKNYLSEMDVFVMSSKSEGLPLTILEAFWYECPVVSTSAGGVSEAIIDNQTGMICRVGDHHCLADKIEKLIEDKGLMKNIIKNAKEKLYRDFDSKTCAEKTLQLYKDAVRKRN